MNSGIEGTDIDMFKLFLLLYTDRIVSFANNPEELQNGLDLLYDLFKVEIDYKYKQNKNYDIS